MSLPATRQKRRQKSIERARTTTTTTWWLSSLSSVVCVCVCWCWFGVVFFFVCSEHLKQKTDKSIQLYQKTNAQTDIERRRSKREREREREKERKKEKIERKYNHAVRATRHRSGQFREKHVLSDDFQHCSALGQRRHYHLAGSAADQFLLAGDGGRSGFNYGR